MVFCLRSLYAFLFFCLCMATLTCSKSSTDPPPDEMPPQIAIPDSTRHDVVWRVDTLGTRSTNLYGVAIIDEDDIWVAGSIHYDDTYTFDSLGNWIEPYNAAHWNGQAWQPVRIRTRLWNTNTFLISTLEAIHHVENRLWVSTSGQLIEYDGNDWGNWTFLFDDLNDTTFGGIGNFWHISESAIYGAGRKGNVFFYDGSAWQKLNSPTTLPITDIFGRTDSESGETEIYCTASLEVFGQEKRLLQITGQQVKTINDKGLPFAIAGIWFSEDSGYYVVGDGIYYKENIQDTTAWVEIVPDITPFYSAAIRGNHKNDIFITGAFGTVIHYNGKTWKNYRDRELPLMNDARFGSIDVKGNTVAAAGYVAGNRGCVIIGKRIP